MTSRPPIECHVAALPKLIEGGGVVPFELARPRPDLTYPRPDWTAERFGRFWSELDDAKADPERRSGYLVYRKVGSRLECVGLHFGDTGDREAPGAPGGPLKAALLHGLPWAGIMAEGAAVVANAVRLHRELTKARTDSPLGPAPEESAASRASGPNPIDRWLASTTAAVGGGRHDPRFWEAVAQIYREAWDNRDPHPVKAVARRMGKIQIRMVPDSTARRWVREARRLGYLGKAPGPRQAGYE